MKKEKTLIEINQEMHELEIKKNEANKIITTYTLAAAGVGAIPLPFADAPILITGQIKMIQDIFDSYEVKHSITAELLLTIIIQKIVSQGAKFLVKYLLKKITFIAGSIVGGGMAAAVTYTMGVAVSEIAYNLKESAIKGGDLNENSEKINSLIEKAIANSFSGLENISEEFLNKFLSKENIEVR